VLGALSLLLNGGGLQQIRTITHELNGALNGNEQKVRDLLGQLSSFAGTLDKQKQQIIDAIQSLDTLASRLSQQKQVLTSTLDTLPGALQVLADERSQMTTMLQALSNLGATATRVVGASEQDFSSALKELQPVLTQLAAGGDALPKSLELLTTYPFPKNVVNAIGGDYTNLNVKLDVDLSGVLQTLTSSSTTTNGSSAGPASTPQAGLPTGSLPSAPALPPVPGLQVPVVGSR
jgi:phospholipid/cholesterol/gamma-HCH transport system substrate-binding protein